MLSQEFQLALQPLRRGVVYRANDQSEQAKGGDCDEPGRAPERWQHRDSQRAAGLIPDSVLVAGRHLEQIPTGRQKGDIGHAHVGGFLPSAFMADERHSVPKPCPLRSGQIETRIINLQALLARLDGDC